MRAGARPGKGWKELGDARGGRATRSTSPPGRLNVNLPSISLIALLGFLAFFVWMESGCG